MKKTETLNVPTYPYIQGYKLLQQKIQVSYNVNRCDAYDIPHDETILIDADYLILHDTLNPRKLGS